MYKHSSLKHSGIAESPIIDFNNFPRILRDSWGEYQSITKLNTEHILRQSRSFANIWDINRIDCPKLLEIPSVECKFVLHISSRTLRANITNFVGGLRGVLGILREKSLASFFSRPVPIMLIYRGRFCASRSFCRLIKIRFLSHLNNKFQLFVSKKNCVEMRISDASLTTLRCESSEFE